jgi:hypothetical protein
MGIMVVRLVLKDTPCLWEKTKIGFGITVETAETFCAVLAFTYRKKKLNKLKAVY